MKKALPFALALSLASCAILERQRSQPAHSDPVRLDPAATSSRARVEPVESEPIPQSASGPFGLGRPQPSLWSHWNTVRGDAYELDDRERFLSDGTRRVVCDPSGLVNYSGKNVRYQGAVRVNPHFLPRLERFEEVVAEVAQEIYGRAPRRIRHYGAYSCRTSRNRAYRLSEHALGNAIDVVGFDFGPAPKGETASPALPKPLRYAFEVRVARHWENQKTSVNEVHARFLRTLLDRLLERDDVFRGVIGPGHRGHSDHFHFDMSPWRFVRL